MKEQPQIDWPKIEVGTQTLMVRWTFYVQWLLSKRQVSLKNLVALLVNREPAMVDTLVECFAAAVAENFSTRGLPVPTAEYWAMTISAEPNALDVWKRCCDAVFGAIRKMGPVDPPTPKPGATTGEQTPENQTLPN